MTPVRLEPAAPLSQVKHSTTEPLPSPRFENKKLPPVNAKAFTTCIGANYILGHLSIKIWQICDIGFKSSLGIENQGCKIPLARSHLQVKCYAGRVKVLTNYVGLF